MGADRVGIVDELSGILAERKGNIEESKMAVLGGEFAVMMLVSMEAPLLEELRGHVADLETRLGLKIGLVPTHGPASTEEGRPYILETVSLDGRGIVYSVSSLLHRLGINIEDMETVTRPAPLTGAPLFIMKASSVLGPGHSVAALKRELERLEADRDLDISLKPLLPSNPE